MRRLIKRRLIDLYKTLKLYKYYYIKSFSNQEKGKKIIVMLDGKMIHGGLSDRLWGILSTYKLCIDNNYEFRLFFNHPYNIEKFLKPNLYDWRINSKEISYNLKDSRPNYISMVYYNREKMAKYATNRLNKNLCQQHVYTNMRYFDDKYFNKYFFQLFKLSPTLESAVEQHKKKLEANFVSITFRFQQLLGDFNEGNFPKLESDILKNDLISKCINLVERIYKLKGIQILVTSDSSTFLEKVAQLPFVYIIPGKIVHVDYNATQESDAVHMKSFLDLFLISNAKEVYSVSINPLYQSGFPKTASLIGNKPYFEIKDWEGSKIIKR